MKLSLACSVLLLGELASAKFHGLNAFNKKAKRAIEKRHPAAPAAPEQPPLRDRTPLFHTEKTKRRSKFEDFYQQDQALTLNSLLGEWFGYPWRSL